MNRPGLLIPVLALASLFFGWRAYDAWTGPIRPAGPPLSVQAVVPIGVSPEEAAPPSDLPVLSAYIASRPVFRSDRRPFREETAQMNKRNYEAEIARFTLNGVLLLGKENKGVVTGKGISGRNERWEVGPGDSLPGFVVKEIGQDGITLTADGEDFLLPLYAGAPKGQGSLRTEVGAGGPRGTAPAPAGPAGKAGSAAATKPVQPVPARTPAPAIAAPSQPPPAQNVPTRLRGRTRYPGQQKAPGQTPQ